MKTDPEAKAVPDANRLPEDYPWANYGMRPPVMKEILIVKATRIHGTQVNVGDVVTVTERDAISLITTGKAKLYPPPPAKEETPEELAERRKDVLNRGPYRVEITRRCQVKGFTCEVGEVVAVCEDDAMNIAICGRGKIISRPPEKQDIRERISSVVEEMLRGRSS